MATPRSDASRPIDTGSADRGASHHPGRRGPWVPRVALQALAPRPRDPRTEAQPRARRAPLRGPSFPRAELARPARPRVPRTSAAFVLVVVVATSVVVVRFAPDRAHAIQASLHCTVATPHPCAIPAPSQCGEAASVIRYPPSSSSTRCASSPPPHARSPGRSR
jgi:hypothetical protein